MVRLVWSREYDIAAIYLAHDEPQGEVLMVDVDPELTNGHEVHLYFETSGVLREIEVRPASKVLPPDLLEGAEVIDE